MPILEGSVKSPLAMWIYDNAELFRYLGEFGCMREKTERILLSGAVSSYFAPLMKTIYPSASVTAVDADEDVLKEAAEECHELETVHVPFSRYDGSGFDIAISALAMQSLDTHELTGYLFSLYDALADGGNLFLSFPSSEHIDVAEKKEVDSWYSMEKKVFMKRYPVADVVKSINIIGFDLRAIEQDDNPDLGRIVSIHAVKGR